MKYRLLKEILEGDDRNGYTCTDTLDCGEYDIPDYFLTVTDDRHLVRLLCSIGLFDNQALQADLIETECLGDETRDINKLFFYFHFAKNAPKSREVYILEDINT